MIHRSIALAAFLSLALLACSGCAGGGVSAEKAAAIRTACASCHLLVPADALPRERWAKVIPDMFSVAKEVGSAQLNGLDPKDVLAYYQAEAPVALQPLPVPAAVMEGRLHWEQRSLPAAAGAPPTPAVSHLAFAHLSDTRQLDLVMSDMRHGFIMALQPYKQGATFKQLAVVGNPARFEVTDLDRDGQPDIAVANLGSFERDDHTDGSVEWLRSEGGTWRKHTLYRGLGRVSDARPADFDYDGDLDLIVAEFGWRRSGRVLLLRNTSPKDDPGKAPPTFELEVLDDRHGAVHVPVGDIDGDGMIDATALLSQEHETVIAFLNRGHRGFETVTLYQAPHPAWGSVCLELADMDKDGDVDAVVANGDSLDDYELKPYQGVRWLENRKSYPFTEHLIAPYYGVNRALPADVDGDGDMDVIASAFLPHLPLDTYRRPLALSGVVWLEQTAPGAFARRTLEPYSVDHPSFAVGDFNTDGRVDLATGWFTMQLGVADPMPNWVTLWTQQPE